MTMIWLNGRILPADEARIPVLDRGVIWGYGLFETLRAYAGRAWAVAEHYERLSQGSEVLGIPIPEPGVLAEAMDAVLAANGHSEAGLRVTVTKGAGPADPRAEATEQPNAFVTGWALVPDDALYEDGASLVTLPGGARPLAQVKSTSYAASVAGRLEARRRGADDGVFVSEGHVLEATGSNIAAVFGIRLVTPRIEEGVLPGVTRSFVLALAEEEGFEVEEGRLEVEALASADEVVLTSTLREVYPASSIDGRTLRRTGVAARLREAFRRRVREDLGIR